MKNPFDIIPSSITDVSKIKSRHDVFHTLFDLMPLYGTNVQHKYIKQRCEDRFGASNLKLFRERRMLGSGASREVESYELTSDQTIKILLSSQGERGETFADLVVEYINALEDLVETQNAEIRLSYQREAAMLEQRTRQAEQDALHLDNVYSEIKRGFDDIKQAYESCLKHVPLREQGLKTLRKRLAALAVRYQGIPAISQASPRVQTPEALRLKIASNEQSYLARLEHDTAEEQLGKTAVDIDGVTVYF